MLQLVGIFGYWIMGCRFLMIEKAGDRNNSRFVVRDYAFTIPANPMSDRLQMVIEIYG